jgi:hypothetical protein
MDLHVYPRPANHEIRHDSAPGQIDAFLYCPTENGRAHHALDCRFEFYCTVCVSPSPWR